MYPKAFKESAIVALKTDSKKAIQKTTEATVDLIGNKIANEITKNYTKILQKQLKVKQKQQKEDIYLQKKGSKVCMN